jgi:hypothetical protein
MFAIAMFFRAETDIPQKNRKIYNEDEKRQIAAKNKKRGDAPKEKVCARVDFCGGNDIISL